MKRRVSTLRSVATGHATVDTLEYLDTAIAAFGQTEDGIDWRMLYRAKGLAYRRHRDHRRKYRDQAA